MRSWSCLFLQLVTALVGKETNQTYIQDINNSYTFCFCLNHIFKKWLQEYIIKLVCLCSQGVVQECLTEDNSCYFTHTVCGRHYYFTVFSITGQCTSQISATVDIRTGMNSFAPFISAVNAPLSLCNKTLLCVTSSLISNLLILHFTSLGIFKTILQTEVCFVLFFFNSKDAV